jgi:hypothetical protein
MTVAAQRISATALGGETTKNKAISMIGLGTAAFHAALMDAAAENAGPAFGS